MSNCGKNGNLRGKKIKGVIKTKNIRKINREIKNRMINMDLKISKAMNENIEILINI
jgi:hypothetical protein